MFPNHLKVITALMLVGIVIVGRVSLEASQAPGTKSEADQEPVDLKVRFEKDKPIYLEISNETNQIMKINGQGSSYGGTLIYYLSWTPKGQDREKNWLIGHKILRVKSLPSLASSSLGWDTADNSDRVPEPLRELVGFEFTLTISDRMELSKLEGQKKFNEKWAKPPQTYHSMVGKILNEGEFKEIANAVVGQIPNKMVKIGDTWTKTFERDVGIGKSTATYKYTYDGRENQLDRITITPAFTFTPAADGTLPFRVVKADLSTKGSTGMALFDREKGRIVSSTMKLMFEGKATIRVGDEETEEVEFESTNKITLKAMDTNPLKAP